MRLTLLEPKFIRYYEKMVTIEVCVGDHETWRERGCPTEEKTVPREWTEEVKTLAEAQGIRFICPLCYAKGGHSVSITFINRGVRDDHGSQSEEGPSRWQVTGTNFEDLSTQPSIHLIGGCGWHGYITNGEAA